MTIEEDIETLLTNDNGNWSSNPTKKEYILGKSNTRALNLDYPVVDSDEVVIVISKFTKSVRNKLGGATHFLYEGDIYVHATNEPDTETAQTRLKTLFDAQYGYQYIEQPIFRDGYKNRYLAIDRLEIETLENDG